MVLYPRDLEALGLPGFGIVTSTMRDAETQAATDVLDGDPGADDRLALYRDTGFRHLYRLSLLRPRIPWSSPPPACTRETCGLSRR